MQDLNLRPPPCKGGDPGSKRCHSSPKTPVGKSRARKSSTADRVDVAGSTDTDATNGLVANLVSIVTGLSDADKARVLGFAEGLAAQKGQGFYRPYRPIAVGK